MANSPVILKGGGFSADNKQADKISGIICTAVATSSGTTPFTTSAPIKVLSLTELERKYGIDKAYDTTNDVVLWYNVSEFYRFAPAGTPLYIWGVNEATAMEDYWKLLKDFVDFSNGTIRQVGFSRCPGAAYTPTYVNGLETDAVNAIAPTQTEAVRLYSDHSPLQVFLEGKLEGGVGNLSSLPDLSLKEANKVSILIGNEYMRYTSGTRAASTASIGTLLGVLAAGQVNERISKVRKFNLKGVTLDGEKRFYDGGGFTDGSPFKDYKDDVNSLDASHYIFIRQFFGKDGFFFSRGYTCAPTSDKEYTVENGRVLDKASRIIYAALLEYWDDNTTLETDGTLPDATRTEIEATIEDAIDKAMKGEISNRRVTIDPTSDLINPPQELRVTFQIQPQGYIGDITGNLLFSPTI